MPEDEIFAFGFGVRNNPAGHYTILQSLNRWFDFSDVGGRKLYYDVDNFRGTEPKWDNVPMIFAKYHPDINQMKRIQNGDVESVVKEMGGYVCGEISSSTVTTAGQPRLEALTSFYYPDLEARYHRGEIALSTGFFCDPDESGRIQGQVRPNHVLVFVQDEQNQPRDYGSGFLNTRQYCEEYMTTANDSTNQNGVMNAGRAISEKNKSIVKQAISILQGLAGIGPGADSKNRCSDDDEEDKTGKNDVRIPEEEQKKKKKPAAGGEGSPAGNKGDDGMGEDLEMKKALEAAVNAKTTAEAAVANLTEQNKALANKVADLEGKLKVHEDQAISNAWDIEKKRLRPDLIHKKEDEDALKELFINNTRGYLAKAVFVGGAASTPEEGAGATNQGANRKGGTVGVYNARTGKYEDEVKQ